MSDVRDGSPGAGMTERLARASGRRPWLVVGVWLVVVWARSCW
jgi:hypothetical protein